MVSLTVMDAVEAIRASDAPVVSTSEIASSTGFTRQHVDEFLRRREDSRLRSTTVGNSKGWYLAEVDHPAIALENRLDGAQLIKITEVDCNRCHSPIKDGEELVALFERADKKWDALDAVCTEHVDDRDDLPSEIGYGAYLQNASERVEFVICRGVCERENREPYNRSVIRNPTVLQYFPRTEPNGAGEMRPSEPIP